MFLFDACPIGIVIYRSNGDFVVSNNAAGAIMSRLKLRIENINFTKVTQWQDSGVLHIINDALINNKRIERDVKFKTMNSFISMHFNCIPFSFESKNYLLLKFSDMPENHDIEMRHPIDLEVEQTALSQTVAAIRALGEMRDPYTAGHEQGVGDLAAAIGAELGFDERRQQGLRIAGYLHDIGKIAAPAEILSKPGRLSLAEFGLIKEHSAKGHEILSNVDFPWPVALVALQHHERMDGGGYPHGLKGEQITIEARIVAVADVVEAMTSHRPYRPALGIEKALAEIERGKGTAFDPEVTDACVRLFRQKGYKLQN